MAKKMRRIMALCIALMLCVGMMTIPAMAWGHDDNRDGNKYEWYQVYVQGNLVASAQGRTGNNLWLGRTYTASVTTQGAILSWYINPNGGNSGSFSGTVDLNNYITIPEGFEVKEISIETTSIEGINSEADQYDNAIITITIKTLYNEKEDETIVLPDPTEPPETEPPETEPPATEPPATEPPATEPPETEPPATEPPETEPPATEPPATESPVTEPPTDESPEIEPYTDDNPIPDPPATEPPATEPPATEPATPRSADVPKTGGSLYFWIALSAVSGTGLAAIALLPRRKESNNE